MYLREEFPEDRARPGARGTGTAGPRRAASSPSKSAQQRQSPGKREGQRRSIGI